MENIRTECDIMKCRDFQPLDNTGQIQKVGLDCVCICVGGGGERGEGRGADILNCGQLIKFNL